MSEHDQNPTPAGPAPAPPPAQQPAPQPAQPPQAAPVEPQPYAQQPAAAQPAPQPPAKKRSGCRTCGMGCLLTFLLLLCIIAVALGWLFNVPVRWGLVASPAEEMFSTSNPWAEEAIEEELAAQGVSLEGVTVFVITGENGEQIAYVLVDGAKGATWPLGGEYRSAVEGFLMLTAGTQAVDTYGITRIAVDHYDAEGVQAAVMTAPTSALRQYVAGAITQEQLFDEMDGYSDLAGMAIGGSE